MGLSPDTIRRPPGPAAGFCLALLLSVSAASAEPAGTITLSQAVDTAMSRHPQLIAYPYDVRAAEGRVLQATKTPNPELGVEIENLDGDLPGMRQSETTAVVGQTVELGKRHPRILRSQTELAVIHKDYESQRLNVVADVKRAFIALLGAQTRLGLAREAQRLSGSLAAVAADRVAAGAVSPIEETRAKVGLATASADAQRAAREVEEARRELSAAMGESAPSFGTASGDLSEDLSVPEYSALEGEIKENPVISRWDAEKDRRRAVLAAERSLAYPDVTLSGGLKYLREESLKSFVLGFSLPIPLFNRNQGGIREAEAQLAKTDAERRGTEVGLATRLGQQHAALATAVREVKLLREEALAGAQNAYDAVNEGYRLGKFRYLDVLDAGKALVEVKQRYVDALTTMNLARAEIERLVAFSTVGRDGGRDKREESGK